MRFHFNRGTCFFILIFLAFSPFAVAQNNKNILLISVDDLNDYTGMFGGHPQAYSPNIDALAAKGTRFQKAYSASPLCNPSRTALMIGRRPHETGITDNLGGGSFRDVGPAWVQALESMPQFFASRGYKTESVDKIFHKPEKSTGEFQVNAGKFGGVSADTIESVAGTNIEWSEGSAPIEETREWKSADYGANFLGQNHNQPFFLAVGFFRPHLPWFAPQEYYNLLPNISSIILPPYLANDLDDTTGGSNGTLQQVLAQGGNNLWKETVRAYLANIAFTDAAIGHLLNALDNSQYANNTIVVLYGDHGWHLGEKDHYRKFSNWERASRTTFIIYDPVDGVVGDVNHAVSLQDIWLTLTELTGVTPPSYTVRGRSLASLVENPNRAWDGAAMVTRGDDNAIFSDRYHYIDKDGGELYDLQTDPNEWINVINDPAYASVKAEMQAGLAAMINHNEDPFGGAENIVPPNDLAAVASDCNTVLLTWTDTSTGESGYRVRRKIVGEPTFTTLGDTLPNAGAYVDGSAVAQTNYQYQVRPLNSSGSPVGSSNKPTVLTPACGGSGVAIPALIEAENYVAFSDTTSGNNGDASCSDTDVDAEITGDSSGVCNVGWTAVGECLEYDISSTGGSFDLVLRLASKKNNKTVTVQLNGSNVGTVTSPNNGWQSWANRTISNVNIPAGNHTLRVIFNNGNVNFNYVDIQ